MSGSSVERAARLAQVQFRSAKAGLVAVVLATEAFRARVQRRDLDIAEELWRAIEHGGLNVTDVAVETTALFVYVLEKVSDRLGGEAALTILNELADELDTRAAELRTDAS